MFGEHAEGIGNWFNERKLIIAKTVSTIGDE